MLSAMELLMLYLSGFIGVAFFEQEGLFDCIAGTLGWKKDLCGPSTNHSLWHLEVGLPAVFWESNPEDYRLVQGQPIP